MHQFKDRFGQDWTIELDLATVQKLESIDYTEAGLTEPVSFFPPQEELFSDIIRNHKVVFTMIWACCEEQAVEKVYRRRERRPTQGSDNQQLVPTTEVVSIDYPIRSMEDFARCFNGESLVAAREAFYAELPDFFQDQRIFLTTLIDRYSKNLKRIDQRISNEMETQMSDERIDQFIEEALEQQQNELPAAMAKIIDDSTVTRPSILASTPAKNPLKPNP